MPNESLIDNEQSLANPNSLPLQNGLTSVPSEKSFNSFSISYNESIVATVGSNLYSKLQQLKTLSPEKAKSQLTELMTDFGVSNELLKEQSVTDGAYAGFLDFYRWGVTAGAVDIATVIEKLETFNGQSLDVIVNNKDFLSRVWDSYFYYIIEGANRNIIKMLAELIKVSEVARELHQSKKDNLSNLGDASILLPNFVIVLWNIDNWVGLPTTVENIVANVMDPNHLVIEEETLLDAPVEEETVESVEEETSVDADGTVTIEPNILKRIWLRVGQFSAKSFLIKRINKLPYVRGLHQEIIHYKKNTCFPPGHFYSPLMEVEDLKSRADEIWIEEEKEEINGINFEAEQQIKFLGELATYYDGIPFKEGKQDNLRYYYNNEFYGYTDSIVLYSMIRHFKPNRIVEIGSGFSSAVMLDTNELFFDNRIDLTFIEPYPDRLYSLMSEEDKKISNIIQSNVQSVSLEVFEKLEAGDILFIDSSHVVKTGSDVNYILFKILPRLKKGVMIHFHDIFHPFEYPKTWVLDTNKNWNENYFLKAFLMYNSNFKIRLFSDYLHKYYKESFQNMPLCYKMTGGNIWLEKQ